MRTPRARAPGALPASPDRELPATSSTFLADHGTSRIQVRFYCIVRTGAAPERAKGTRNGKRRQIAAPDAGARGHVEFYATSRSLASRKSKRS